MAQRILQGADWSVAGNWIQTPGGSSGVPIDNDEAILKAAALIVNAGLDQGAIDLDALILPRGSSGELGQDGAPLLIAFDLLKHFGAGELHLSVDLDGASAHIADLIRLQCEHPGVLCDIGSNPADAGSIEHIIATRCNATIRGDSKFTATTKIWVGSESGSANDVRMKIAAAGTGTGNVVDYKQSSGVVTCNRTIVDGVVWGGILTIDVKAVTGTLVILGGVVNYDFENQASDSTDIEVWPGATLNLCRNHFAKGFSTLWEHPGSIIIEDPGLHTFTTRHRLNTK